MDARRWMVMLGSIALGATAFLLLRREPCVSAAQKLGTLWDANRRVELQKAFASNRSAQKTVESAFDAFTASWSAAWDQSCSDKEASVEALARKRVCLDGRLAQLAALSELFARADSNVVANAVVSVERLSSFGPCNDKIAEVPKATRSQIAKAQSRLAHSEVLRRAGKHAEALAAANEAVTAAESSGYPPVVAEALLARADVQRTTGKVHEAELTLGQARVAAQRGRDFETLTRICISQLVLAGRADKADVWVKCAEDALAQFPHPSLRGDLDLAVSVLRIEQGRPAECEAAARRARDAFERNKQTARTLDATGILALALAAQGNLVEAITHAQTALDGRLALLGEDHPQTVRSRISLAETLLKAGRPEQALATLEPLTEKQLSGLPPVTAAAALCCRGAARTRLLSPQGLDDLKRCVGLVTAAYDEKHPNTAAGHDALAAGWRLQGDLRRAVDEHELAIAAFGARRTAETAAAHASYAVTLLAKGAAPAAAARAKVALQMFDLIPKEQAIDACPALWVLAEAGVRQRKASAATDARATLACLGDPPGREADRARAWLTLATALGRTPEAVELLKKAALHPTVQLAALDTLAALRPFDSEAGCAAAIEALVREHSDLREKAARGCKLPRR